MRIDRRTDRRTDMKLIVAFRRVENALKYLCCAVTPEVCCPIAVYGHGIIVREQLRDTMEKFVTNL
jgi:hypothetical protein